MPRPLPADPRRILLVRLSSLGDVVGAMPLALGLARRFPRADLRWAVEPDAAPLLSWHGSGAAPVEVPRRGGLTTRGRTVATLRSLMPDLVVDAQGNTKSGTVARLAARGAPILGFDRSEVREWSNASLTTHRAPPSGETHVVLRNLALLRALGGEAPRDPPEYGLRATEDEEGAATAALRGAGVPEGAPVALLHPGRLRDVRAWTVGGLVALAEALHARGRTVVLEGPDRDRHPAHRATLAALVERGVARDLGGDLPLRTLVGLVSLLARRRRATGLPHLAVAPDTLLPHLCAALDLPVVLLAGPQDPARTGPLGRRTAAVTAWEGLPCAPCLRRSCDYEVDRACMDRITVAAVVGAVEGLAE